MLVPNVEQLLPKAARPVVAVELYGILEYLLLQAKAYHPPGVPQLAHIRRNIRSRHGPFIGWKSWAGLDLLQEAEDSQFTLVLCLCIHLIDLKCESGSTCLSGCLGQVVVE